MFKGVFKMFNFINSKKKKDVNKINDQPINIATAYEIDEEELFREDPNEKAKIEAWWLQKEIEEVVEEDYENETDPESDKDDELMEEDSDDLIYSLKEEDDDDDDMDLVIKKALDALGDSTSEELLEIGKEVLLNIKERIPIKNEIVIENDALAE